MRRGILTACAVAVLAVGASAQFSGWAQVVGQGVDATVRLNLYERYGTGLELANDCVIQEVRAGTQQGVTVWQAIYCSDVVIPIGPYGSIAGTWNLRDSSGRRVPDGAYFLRVSSRQAGVPALTDQWFGVTVDRKGRLPALVQDPQIFEGIPHMMIIYAPAYAGATYYAALSLSTDTGFDIFGGYLHAALDMDSLFNASLLSPNTGPFMLLQGGLDANGLAGLGFTVPTGLPPSFHHLNIHVQALLVGDQEPGPERGLPPALTNVASGVLFLPTP